MGSSSWIEHRNLERSARELNTTDQDEVKACDNTNLICKDQTVTETSTTTAWETETNWETVSEDATTTEETTSTSDSTVHVTVSDVNTGTTTITTTKTITDSADSATELSKRFVFAYPQKTQWPEASYTSQAAKCTMATAQIFYIRPAPSLNSLAEVLLRRGIEVHRRDTVTETDWVTESATATVTDTTTETEWHTEWATSVEIDEVTKTHYAKAEEMVTITETETKHVEASASDPGATALSESTGSNSDGPSTGTIVGAAVGGVVGVVLLLAAVWWYRRRNSTAGEPPVVSRPNSDVQVQPVVTETQSPKPVVPINTRPAGYEYTPADPYEFNGTAAVAWTQEHRHSNTGSWGSSPPPTYLRNTPLELSGTPSPYAEHAELPSSPRMYSHEMESQQGYYPAGYSR
ncbi:uncharacterized protein AUP68_00823 [Ilyonectria robusta]